VSGKNDALPSGAVPPRELQADAAPKIVEPWDVLQRVPDESANQNTLF